MDSGTALLDTPRRPAAPCCFLDSLPVARAWGVRPAWGGSRHRPVPSPAQRGAHRGRCAPAWRLQLPFGKLQLRLGRLRSPKREGDAAAGASSAELSPAAALCAWLAENGVYMEDRSTWGKAPHGLLIADGTTDEGEPCGRGLLAKREIRTGESMFEVPLHLCMTRGVADRRFERLGVPEMAGVDDYLALASLLLYEDELRARRGRGECEHGSFWDPYLRMLPRLDTPLDSSDASPLNLLWLWSEDDLAWLEGSPALMAARLLRDKIDREYADMLSGVYSRHPQVFETDSAFTLEKFRWAFGILFSRAALMPSDAQTLALVPYADLVNHSPFSDAYIDMQSSSTRYAFRPAWKSRRHHWLAGALSRGGRGDDHRAAPGEYPNAEDVREPPDREIVAYSDREYNPLDQIFVSYGQKSNAELLLFYGFVSERNPYNSVEMSVSLRTHAPQDDPLLGRKMAFLQECGRDPHEPERFPLFADRYPMELRQFLRFAHLTEDDVAGAADLEQVDVTRPVSAANERASVQALVDACRKALAAYPTSADEDDLALADSQMAALLTLNQRLAIRLRRSEKRILDKTIASVQREFRMRGG